ncbi:hypothetical protein [Pseudomonas putida]|nr:hypothetical protein [Pseudomonas putida]WBM44750.1 hypothetical protein M2J85_18640 [Pseudomonas putida]
MPLISIVLDVQQIPIGDIRHGAAASLTQGCGIDGLITGAFAIGEKKYHL